MLFKEIYELAGIRTSLMGRSLSEFEADMRRT